MEELLKMPNVVRFFLVLYIWAIFELVNVKVLFKHVLFLKRKKEDAIKCVSKALLFIIIIAIYGYFSWNRNMIGVMLFIPLIFLKSSILMTSYYQINAKHVAFAAFFVELVSFAGCNVRILTPFFHWKDNLINGYVYEILGEIVLFILVFLLIMLKKKNIIQFWIADLPVIDFVVFTVLLFSISVWETVAFLSEKWPIRLYLFYVAIILCTLVTIIRTMIITRNNNSLTDFNNLLEEQMKQATDYYNQLIEQENQTKKFRHDIKNLLIALHSMIREEQNEKALKYIEDLNEVCDQLRPKYDTGNFIADAILNTKETKAEKFNTKISFEGAIPAERIKDVDMVIVLSNMLDNAIEACSKIDGEKTISIKSALRKSAWVLNVMNPSPPVKVANNHIETTKDEKEIHGFGLSNIERAAKRYEGNMKLSYENGTFKSVVSFMLN